MSVDAAVVTKDRPEQLMQTIRQLRQSVTVNKIIVVDSTAHPEDFPDVVIYTPDATLGYARQQALLHAETAILAFVDDDVILEKGWFKQMLSALNTAPEALAVSSKVVYGWQSDKIIEKLHRIGARPVGGSIGVSMLKTQQILDIGGFNVNVHRGEDTELHIRINQHGFKWIREHMAVAYHKMTLRQYWRKAEKDADGWCIMWAHLHNKFKYIMKRFASSIVMPIYYGMLTRDPRVTAVYGSFKWKILFHFLHKKGRVFD